MGPLTPEPHYLGMIGLCPSDFHFLLSREAVVFHDFALELALLGLVIPSKVNVHPFGHAHHSLVICPRYTKVYGVSCDECDCNVATLFQDRGDTAQESVNNLRSQRLRIHDSKSDWTCEIFRRQTGLCGEFKDRLENASDDPVSDDT